MIYGYDAPLEDADALGLLPEPAEPEYAEFPACNWVPTADPLTWQLRDTENDVVLSELIVILGGYSASAEFLDCTTEFDADHMADAQDKALSIVRKDWLCKNFTVEEYADWAEENLR